MSCAGISKNPFSLFSTRSAVAALLFCVPGAAFGQGYSTDIELVRPVFSHKGLPGIDTPVMAAQPTLRTGFMTQYQRDPVILYQFDEELGGDGNGAVVKHRSTMVLGISYDFTPSVSTRLIIPTAIHSGSDIPELEADGFGLEDIGVGVRFRAFQVGGFSLGARADFTMPTGAKESFHGEDGLRTGAGALAMFETGPFQALFDANVMTRSKVELAEDWTHGSELAMNAGVKYWVMPDRVAIWAAEIEGVPRGACLGLRSPPRRHQTTARTPWSARVAIVSNTTQLPGCALRTRSWEEAFTRIPILVKWHLLLLAAEEHIAVLRSCNALTRHAPAPPRPWHGAHEELVPIPRDSTPHCIEHSIGNAHKDNGMSTATSWTLVTTLNALSARRMSHELYNLWQRLASNAPQRSSCLCPPRHPDHHRAQRRQPMELLLPPGLLPVLLQDHDALAMGEEEGVVDHATSSSHSPTEIPSGDTCSRLGRLA